MRTMLILAALLLAAAGAGAQGKSLSDLMDATGLKYKITKSGNAVTTYSLDDGRTQDVYLSTRQYQVGALNLREIWSNAASLNDLDAEVAQQLLADGGQENVGGWMIEQNDDDSWLIYYSARLPDLSAADLKSVMRYIAAVADAKEEELDGGDDN